MHQELVTVQFQGFTAFIKTQAVCMLLVQTTTAN